MKAIAALVLLIVGCTNSDPHVRVGCGDGYSLVGSPTGFTVTVGENAGGSCTVALPKAPEGKRLVCTVTGQPQEQTLSWQESDATITIVNALDGRTYDAACGWTAS